MDTYVKKARWPRTWLTVAVAVLLVTGFTAEAGKPAFYSPANDRVFWFIHVSDPHIGASGSTDATRLKWVVSTGRSVINPAFIVATGDLTDSTNGNIFGLPNGPYQAEWDEYKGILAAANAGPDIYYDLPGNHDAYSDATFAYYRANAVQGRATHGTQLSWIKTFPFGTYHFLGVNTADNTGAPFSLTFPWGDHAGLDATELAFINTELGNHTNANMTLVFGHHPVTDTGNADDTWLFYGQQEFIDYLDLYKASLYDYGHTHRYAEALFQGNSYTGLMTGDGVRYVSVASLGKSSASNYSVVAVDCDGLSSVTQAVGTWPVVLITAPLNQYLGGAVNPYAYPVPNATSNPLRALVFDTTAISQVRYRLDGASTWLPMTRVAANPALWEGAWDASGLAAGDHTIEVQAVGSTTRSHTITVAVTGATNRPPVAQSDSYSTPQDTPLQITAPGVLGNDSDPDGDALTVQLASPPAHGALTLNADGSFVYTPTAGYSGADSFTYVAWDGTMASTPATVTIAVTAATDTVTILTATYTKKTRRLTVEATSSAQPNAVLTVVGPDNVTYGTMTYNTKTKKYTYQITLPSAPAKVTVQSDKGGTATKNVTIK
jgi:VCBS repeat-containing protein